MTFSPVLLTAPSFGKGSVFILTKPLKYRKHRTVMHSLISKLQSYYRISLYKNAFYLMINTPIASILGFIFWILAARYYSPQDVGLAAALISAANLLAVFSNLGFNFSLIKFLPDAKNPNSLINSSLTVVFMASLFLAACFLFLLKILSPALLFVSDNIFIFLAFIIISIVWAMSPLIDNIFVAMRESKFALARNSIFNILKIPLAIYFLVFFGAFGIFTSWGIAMIIANSLALIFFVRKSLPGFQPAPALDKLILKDMLDFSLCNYAANLLYISSNLILPLMVVNLMGAQMNAYFYVTLMIAELLFIIPTAVSQSLFAEGSHGEKDLRGYVKNSFKLIYILTIPAILAIFLVGDKLLMLFGGEYFKQGADLLRIFAISSLFLGINMIYMTILRLRKKVKEIIAVSGFLALGILYLAYLLLLTSGSILSVGYAWLLFHAVLSIYSAWSIFTKVLKNPSGLA